MCEYCRKFTESAYSLKEGYDVTLDYEGDAFIDFFNSLVIHLEGKDAVAPKVSTHGLVESYRCGNCGKHLVNATYARDNYCSKCGKAVKWNA